MKYMFRSSSISRVSRISTHNKVRVGSVHLFSTVLIHVGCVLPVQPAGGLLSAGVAEVFYHTYCIIVGQASL